jgi:hypothetical protein
MTEPLIQCDITTETVMSENATTHEEHPESYSPRVFFSTVQKNDEGVVIHVRHYELLQTGYALKWKSLPTRFEFMHFTIPALACFNKMKVDRPETKWSGTYVSSNDRLGEFIPSLEMRS